MGLVSIPASIGAAAPASLVPRPPAEPGRVDQATRLRVTQVLGQLPIRFEENKGQVDPAVRYLARSSGYDLFLTADDAVVVLKGSASAAPAPLPSPPGARDQRAISSQERDSAVVRMRLVGARSAPRFTALDPLPGRTHYLVGNEPSRWRPGLVSHGRVRVEDVYPGIDLVYYGNERQLEYDLVVAPGVDPGVIALAFSGARRLEVDAAGDLIVHVPGRQLRMRKPLVYQEHDGARHEVLGHYVLLGPDRVGFRVGAHDAAQALVIDPVLLYSTYLGGSSDDTLTGVAVDSSGHVYVAGYTYSTDYPTTPGAVQPHFAGGSQRDAFVTKLAPDGTLVYSTYLGGTNDDTASDMAVDSLGRVWVVGATWSTDFPSPNPPTATPTGLNGFVAQLTADGSALVYSSVLGGSRFDSMSRVAIDSSGSIYLAGYTESADFPTVNPVQPGCAASFQGDVFLAKLDANTKNPVYSTCLGGSGFESVVGIGVDAGGNLYVGGETGSTDFPTKNPVQANLGGGAYPRDAFLAKVDANGALVYSTYLGGYGYDNEYIQAFAVDGGGNAYIVGGTGSSNFPTANAVQPALGGSIDGFVTKLDGQGAFVYSTYLGGSDLDEIYGITTDAAGNAYLTGITSSTNFPTTPGVLQPRYGGNGNAFVTKLSPTGALLYSTFLGGSGVAGGQGLAADSSGSVYVTGYSRSADFPTPPPDWVACPGRGGSNPDAFVAKLAVDACALVYSACLGGTGYDGGRWVALDKSGNAYVVGMTYSTDFPTTPDAPQRTYGGGWGRDAFVARIGEALPPTVDAGGPYAVGEGGSVELTAVGSDPQGQPLTYDWDLDGDGTFELQNVGSTVAFSAANLDGPTSRTVTVRATDAADLTATATATVSVLNVPPTATFAATPQQLIVGQCVTLAFTNPYDPSGVDTAAGFHYSFDCDDRDGVLDAPNSPTSSFVCHATTAGTFSAVGTIADKDGGVSRYAAPVVVHTAQDVIQESIVTIIDQLVASGVLNEGQGNALITSANAAIAALNGGDVQTATNVLGALVNKLEAAAKTGKIPADVAGALITAAQQIITILQGGGGGGGGGTCPAI
jgi:hypothetical protein